MKIKRFILFVVVCSFISWYPVSAKNDKPKKPDKVVIIHSGGHDNGHNPHPINVSCKARGHKEELGSNYCGKKHNNDNPPEDTTTIPDNYVPGNNPNKSKNSPNIENVSNNPVLFGSGGNSFKCLVY